MRIIHQVSTEFGITLVLTGLICNGLYTFIFEKDIARLKSITTKMAL